MTCPYQDRLQLMAFDAASAAHGGCSTSRHTSSATNTRQPLSAGGSLTEARGRAYSRAKTGPNKREAIGEARALTNMALGLYSQGDA